MERIERHRAEITLSLPLSIPEEEMETWRSSVEEMAQMAQTLGERGPLEDEPSLTFDPRWKR